MRQGAGLAGKNASRGEVVVAKDFKPTPDTIVLAFSLQGVHELSA
jgi:hypothetical protein